MQRPTYLPHIDLLLQALRVNRERLGSKSKIAIDAKLLRSLIQAAVARQPFSEEFYQHSYPDIAEAYAAGKIPDLQQHFVETGFFEGRLGVAAGGRRALLCRPLQGRRASGDAGRYRVGRRTLPAAGSGRGTHSEPADQAGSRFLGLDPA